MWTGPKQKMPTTAICIAGAARGFGSSNVTASLQHMRRLLSCNGTSDIFLHLKFYEPCERGEDSCGAASSSAFSIDQFGRALRALRPIAFLDVDDRRDDTDAVQAGGCIGNASSVGPICRTGREYSCKFQEQFKRLRRCYDLVVAYEQQHSISYKWVVRLRPDLIVDHHQHFGFCESARSRVERYSNGQTHGDHFARLTRRDARVYFAAGAAADQCVPLTHLQRRCHATIADGEHVFPECLLTHHLRTHNVSAELKEHQAFVKGTMVRSDGGMRKDLTSWW
jgi:hypothetical protein